MKTLIAITSLALALPVSGEVASYETVQEPKIGEGNAFEISKSRRAILKTGEGYLILDLLDSSREDGDQTFTEACRIAWTLITPSSVRNDIANALIRYRSTKTGDDSVTVEKIGGTDKLSLGGVSLRWSYGSPGSVFIYADPGTQYAITNVEVATGNGLQPSPAL